MSCKLIGVLDSVESYGKERANIQVLRFLKQNDCDVLLLVNKRASAALKREVSDFTTEFVDFPRGIKGAFSFLGYLRSVIVSNYYVFKVLIKNHPQIVLIPTEVEFLFLFLPLVFFRVNIIFRMGDDPLSYRKRGKLITRIYAFIWKNVILKRINSIVCISKYIQNRLIESGRKLKENDIIIYNYPPARTYSIDSGKSQIDEQKLRVGYIGRIVPDKGVILLVEAVISLLDEGKKLELFIAGDLDLDPLYSRTLQDLVYKNNKYVKNIHFLGTIYDIKTFYSEIINVVCVPSIYEEPLSNVIVEAKSYHKPSIIFKKGGMPEIINHKLDGYICKGFGIESLSEALNFYYENPQSLIEHGENAFKSIIQLGIDKLNYENSWKNLVLKLSGTN